MEFFVFLASPIKQFPAATQTAGTAGFNHRRFNSLKEGEKVVFLSIEEYAAQKSGEFPELFFVQRVEPVVAGNDESLAERHFQIKLDCVGGRYEELRE